MNDFWVKIRRFVGQHFGLLVTLTVALCFFGLAASPQRANAADLSAKVTGLSATDAQEDGNTVSPTTSSEWYAGPVHQLTYHFKVANGVQINDGDTAKLTLPTGARFRTPEKFPVKAANTNETVGEFSADPNTSTGQLTFTNATYWSKYNQNRSGSLQFSVTGSRQFTPSYGATVFLAKNGWAKNESVRPNGTLSQVTWQVLVNPNNHRLNNVVVNDNLGNTSAQSMNPSSIYVTDNATGQTIPTSYYSVQATSTGFKFQWHQTLDKAINIMSTTNISNDNAYSTAGQELDLPNTAALTATDVTNSKTGTSVKTSNTKTVVLTMGKGSANGNHVDQTTNLNVQKVWQNVPTNVKTPAVTAKLYADGQDTGKTVALNTGNSYKGSFTGLEKYAKDGHLIKYTVNEASVPTGYQSNNQNQPIAPDSNGNVTLTNTFKKQNCFTYVKVTKQWQNVPFLKVTPDVRVVLYRNGNPYRDLWLNSCNDYTATFNNLPQYDQAGQAYTYTVAEPQVPHDYQTTTPGQRTPVNHQVTLVNVYHEHHAHKHHHSCLPDWDWIWHWHW
ncbi:Cna B-type domain-containing protein [Lentilactobacillus raoultii]|uniref:Cna B-type domain-containing protein n=1 Tax=Lentilactobacillus raoultii TaxID=1987503 RepID=A0ABW3PMY1_9LACO|nr:Cna B-type domain-containing protein [Lentilactobacillus raoultii]